MRLRARSIILAAIALILLTALPMALPMYVPQEFFRAFTMMAGIDLAALLIRIEILGVAVSAFILLNGSINKATMIGLGVSIANKVFWMMVLLFVLGLGYIENLGVAIIGGTSGGASNIVMFDFRLIALLATVIVAMMIAHNIIEFRESKPIV
jgi:hypothetical protein